MYHWHKRWARGTLVRRPNTIGSECDPNLKRNNVRMQRALRGCITPNMWLAGKRSWGFNKTLIGTFQFSLTQQLLAFNSSMSLAICRAANQTSED